ncbi:MULTISPECIES: TetR/AcrR family transcriptional regulator [Streptomyces]|uniref:TetR/AcrR family transcriptional regulator n=1 Tax=Streptomyces tendae TaxID=1932 RepID=A0A6B3QXE3_STRTE|nr:MULTISPECIES: TetR/AcrR family transcriptional regulator [Streptomyces]BET51473.1 TetR/AcrR family transcriptional regulator [Kitasatospora aureofaciens]MBQ0962083.1 TetR/AcrR family transcriptional regulator [Streptomyces sp. RK74B]MBQ1001865.1 TetR/AcrR family transcriptional regulator [Streptomyces sp. RK23]MZG14428.1 TetR family transcriptional regulator [Streptomyces sp. SID5914]NEV90921.1 TetR/AcrR family transcriptional regulator [Streptomyces tendae]
MAARRGEKLREHILMAAKDVFLEAGFERTSMDVVAQRAETSKRSLYAHFPSKDALFSGVVALVRELYLDRLGSPEHYVTPDRADPADALVRYCGRLLQLLLWSSSLRTLRMGIAEAERVPEIASGYYEAVFEAPTARISAYLSRTWGLTQEEARETAEAIVGRTVHPELVQGLLGVRAPIAEQPSKTALATDVDLDRIAASVRQLLPRKPARS